MVCVYIHIYIYIYIYVLYYYIYVHIYYAGPHLHVFWYTLNNIDTQKMRAKSSCNLFSMYISRKN